MLAAAFAVYLVGLVLVRRGARFGAVFALACAIQLAPLAAPLLISTDAWTYWDYGRIAAVHDANPSTIFHSTDFDVIFMPRVPNRRASIPAYVCLIVKERAAGHTPRPIHTLP